MGGHEACCHSDLAAAVDRIHTQGNSRGKVVCIRDPVGVTACVHALAVFAASVGVYSTGAAWQSIMPLSGRGCCPAPGTGKSRHGCLQIPKRRPRE
jgi:hypothetical protein